MDALGISIFDIVVYMVLFAVIYIVVNKFVLKSLLATLEKRQTEIKEGLKLKNDMEGEKNRLTEKEESIKNEMDIELKKSKAKAMQDVKAERKVILEQARTEADEIIAKANQKLSSDRARMEKELQARVEKATRKVLKKLYNQDKAEIDNKLITESIKEL